MRQPNPKCVEIESSKDRIETGFSRPLAPADFVKWYFRMEELLSDVIRKISVDAPVASAVRLLPGLRLIRVEPVECLITFLSSPQNRIAKIALILNAVGRAYGERMETSLGNFYAPPLAARLARARSVKLASCGLRYGVPQAKNLIRTFRHVADHGDFFRRNYGSARSYGESWQAVMSDCVGAGPKVSDCMCLFALDHLEAVPVDVHVFNSTLRLYRNQIKGLRAKAADFLTLREYRLIGDFYRRRFGKLAGYAQQYLFSAERVRRGFFTPSTPPRSYRSPTRSRG